MLFGITSLSNNAREILVAELEALIFDSGLIEDEQDERDLIGLMNNLCDCEKIMIRCEIAEGSEPIWAA
jgi:hypothetical protein